MKKILLLMLGVLMVHADTISESSAPLFAKVINLVGDDLLNVREHPDSHAKKIAALPLDARVGVDRCKSVGKALWCQIHPLAQTIYEGYDEASPSGWVNARYLSGSNRGYVVVNGVGKCDYLLDCEVGICRVVTGVKFENGTDVAGLVIQSYPRAVLSGQSAFGAVSSEMEGYCASGRWIEAYLAKR